MEGIGAARDLTVEEPVPFGVELDGYAHLPRLLDKARATLAGTAGRYEFGCPVDHTCMARLGVTPELVLDLAARHADDRGVLQALRDRGIPPAADAWFDAVAVEDELQETGTYLRVRRREALPEQAGGRWFAGADHGADVDLALVDLAPGQAGGGPAAAAEVWAVQEGVGTFFLGRLQARIVRAGEVVRIPAGVPWRVENRSDGSFRAVVARPAKTAPHLFAGLRVRDVAAARPWYERLLGEPSFHPNATETVWTLAGGRSVYIVEDPARAGHGAILLFVDDLDARVAAIAGRGIEPAARETYGNGVRKVTYRDPDGNEVSFGAAAAPARSPA